MNAFAADIRLIRLLFSAIFSDCTLSVSYLVGQFRPDRRFQPERREREQRQRPPVPYVQIPARTRASFDARGTDRKTPVREEPLTDHERQLRDVLMHSPNVSECSLFHRLLFHICLTEELLLLRDFRIANRASYVADPQMSEPVTVRRDSRILLANLLVAPN
jgi:hypothetical protein